MTAIALHMSNVSKTFGAGPTFVSALEAVSLDIQVGEFVAIMGTSGSGKSTLMHIAAGLERADSGRIVVGDIDISQLTDAALTKVRRDRIGFVFQSFNLVPTLTVSENIRLPFALAGRRPDDAYLDMLTAWLSLGDRLHHRPHELSGGQQQRVAIVRALGTRPAIVFADEPTGNLDSRTAAGVLDLLRAASREHGQSICMVTHDPSAAARADRVVLLRDGRVVASYTGLDSAAISELMLTPQAVQA